MPTAPTITVADNEDSTATVTVSGSDGGTTNTAYYAQASYDENDGGEWSSGGSRTGDGTIAVTPVPIRNRGGVYYWHVISSDGSPAISNIVKQRVSGSSQTVYERILEQVQSDIAGAGLDGIQARDVVLQTVPDKIDRRMIIVAPTEPESMLATGTNTRDDIVYRVTVAHVDPANRSQRQANRNRWLSWRQDIARLFRRQHLTGVDEVRDCTVNYRNQADTTAWYQDNLCVGALTLNFTAREVRTL